MICISCKSSQMDLFLKMPNAPSNVQKLLIDKEFYIKKKVILKIYKCKICTLVQLAEDISIEDDYYNDYIMTRTHSPFLRSYQKKLARKFVRSFNLVGKKILEIGCGDGYFSTLLSKEKASVLAVEPSKTAANIARKKGIRVIEDYVDDNFQLSEMVNAFVACQVFEHIRKPDELLKNIKRFLLPGAFGLIEVPSLLKTISSNRFYDFFPDHVAYYSVTSLSYLLSKFGFEVIDIYHAANDEYIVAEIKYPENSSAYISMQNTFEKYKYDFESFFRKLSNKRIAFWGAGAKGVTMISLLGIKGDNIVFCVDSDPNKQGKYLPGGIKIVSPSKLSKENVDVIVITAMMYKDEIINILRNSYNYKDSQIAVIAPAPSFIK